MHHLRSIFSIPYTWILTLTIGVIVVFHGVLELYVHNHKPGHSKELSVQKPPPHIYEEPVNSESVQESPSAMRDSTRKKRRKKTFVESKSEPTLVRLSDRNNIAELKQSLESRYPDIGVTNLEIYVPGKGFVSSPIIHNLLEQHLTKVKKEWQPQNNEFAVFRHQNDVIWHLSKYYQGDYVVGTGMREVRVTSHMDCISLLCAKYEITDFAKANPEVQMKLINDWYQALKRIAVDWKQYKFGQFDGYWVVYDELLQTLEIVGTSLGDFHIFPYRDIARAALTELDIQARRKFGINSKEYEVFRLNSMVGVLSDNSLGGFSSQTADMQTRVKVQFDPNLGKRLEFMHMLFSLDKFNSTFEYPLHLGGRTILSLYPELAQLESGKNPEALMRKNIQRQMKYLKSR